MSFWTLSTKADIGICGFANSLPNLFNELSRGMMNLLIAEDTARNLNKFQRHTAVWRVEIETSHQDYESLILVWLEEILYKLEIDNRFYVDGQYMILVLRKSTLICFHESYTVHQHRIYCKFPIYTKFLPAKPESKNHSPDNLFQFLHAILLYVSEIYSDFSPCPLR